MPSSSCAIQLEVPDVSPPCCALGGSSDSAQCTETLSDCFRRLVPCYNGHYQCSRAHRQGGAIGSVLLTLSGPLRQLSMGDSCITDK